MSMVDLTDAGLRERATAIVGEIYSRETIHFDTGRQRFIDWLTIELITLRDAARSEQREQDAKIASNMMPGDQGIIAVIRAIRAGGGER